MEKIIPNPIIKMIAMYSILLLLAGCAKHYTETTETDSYGFFSGFWHGFVFLFAVIANILSWLFSLFGVELFENIQLIGRPNTGLFYYVGFVFGLSASGGSGAATSNSK